MIFMKWIVVVVALTLSIPSFANPPKDGRAEASSIPDEDLSLTAASAWLKSVRDRLKITAEGESQDVGGSEVRQRSRSRRARRQTEVSERWVNSKEDPRRALLEGTELPDPDSHSDRNGYLWFTSQFRPNPSLRNEASQIAKKAVNQFSSELVKYLGNERAFLALAFLVLRAGNLNPLASEVDPQLIRNEIETKLAEIAAEISQKYGVENLDRLKTTFPDFEWSSLKHYQIRMRAKSCPSRLQAL